VFADLTTEDTENAFKQSQEEIAVKFKLPDLELTTDPMSLKVPKDYESKQLITQYLQDIGYVKEGNVAEVSEAAQKDGIRRWIRESKKFKSDRFKYDHTHSLFKFHPLDSDSIDFLYLAAQLGFEAEFEIKTLPIIGEVSLLSRIIHYRLRVFGVFTQDVDTPFSEVSLNALKAVATILRQSEDILQVVNLLGNIKVLSESFMKHQGTWAFIFKQRPASPEVLRETYISNIADINEDILNLENRKRLWEYERVFVSSGIHKKDRSGRRVWAGENGLRYYRKSQMWGKVRQLVRNRLSAGEAHTNIINKFGFELLQLRLWLLGFYKGELDGDWGPLTMLAVKEFLHAHGIDDLNKVIKPVEGGYAVVNMRYLFKRLLVEADKLAESVSEHDAKQLSLNIFAEAKLKTEWEVLDQAHEKVEGQDAGVQSTRSKRRRSFSFRGLLSAVGRFLSDVARSIIDAVKKVWSALKKMAAYAVKIFKQGIEMIKQGIQIVGLAIKRAYYWLLQKPIFSNNQNALVVTRFTHDGDAFHFASNGDKILLNEHLQTIKKMNFAFSIMAPIGFKALALIKDYATFNWLKIAWKLYSLISGDFWDELKLAYARYQAVPLL